MNQGYLERKAVRRGTQSWNTDRLAQPERRQACASPAPAPPPPPRAEPQGPGRAAGGFSATRPACHQAAGADLELDILLREAEVVQLEVIGSVGIGVDADGEVAAGHGYPDDVVLDSCRKKTEIWAPASSGECGGQPTGAGAPGWEPVEPGAWGSTGLLGPRVPKHSAEDG